MTTATVEVEVPSSFPANEVFKVFSNFDKIAPKADPATFKSFETIEGDGGVGTVRIVTFADGVPYKSAKQRVDAIDPNNFSYGYTFFEGDILLDILDSITNHLKIVPSAEGGCVFKQTLVYNCKGSNKPSDEILNFAKEAHKKTFKKVEAYAAANPQAY